MLVTTHQPIFLPWSGFFAKAIHADVMVLLDDVQFPHGHTWLTRNRVKSDKGELWLTVPVWRKGRGIQQIRNVQICNERNWRGKQLRSIREQYANAPYLSECLLEMDLICRRNQDRLIDLNLDLIRFLWEALGIKSRLILQSDLGVPGKGTELLISICRALKADAYVTFPGVEKHIDKESFKSFGIPLNFCRFSPPIYPQLWSDFRHNLSALDLLFNCGPKSLAIIRNASGLVH